MEKEQKNDLAFMQHLEELRWRIIRSLIAIVLLGFVMWFLKGWLIENVFIAMTKPDFISFKIMCHYLGMCVGEIPVEFQSNRVASQFSYGIYMSIIGGFIIAFPYIFYQFWSFIKPGLKMKEAKAAKGITISVSILFLIGVLFGYFIVAPLCVKFFGDFTLAKEFQNIWKIASFMSMIISSVVFSGILFLLPVFVYLFTKIGLLSPEILRKYRKHAIVGVLILSAIITPPDFISQVIVAIPIVLLYEVSVLVSVRVHRKEERKMEA